MKKLAVAFGFDGKILREITKSWKFFEERLNIRFMSNNHALPHITIVYGKTENTEKIYQKLKKIKFKKFVLSSPGLGIFANKDPSLYIRWEKDFNLIKYSILITKKSSKYFKKVEQGPVHPMWVPKTTLAWKDLKYNHLDMIYKKTKFMFTKKYVTINRIYLIDYTFKEQIIYTINLK